MDPNWVLINYHLEVTLHPGARGFCVRARGVEPEDMVCGVRAREYGNLVIFGFGTLDSNFGLRTWDFSPGLSINCHSIC